MFLSTPTVAHSGLITEKYVVKILAHFSALIKPICRTWWILKKKWDVTNRHLSSSSVTTPSYSFFRSGESKYWFHLLNHLSQLDSGDSCDDSGEDQQQKNTRLHTVPCLYNVGSWLGCLLSGSHIQPPLLCSASFSGLSLLDFISVYNFIVQGQREEHPGEACCCCFWLRD